MGRSTWVAVHGQERGGCKLPLLIYTDTREIDKVSTHVGSHLLSYSVLKGTCIMSPLRSVSDEICSQHCIHYDFYTYHSGSFFSHQLTEQIPQAEPANETITFAMCTATLHLPSALQMDLFGPILNINIAGFCAKCVRNAFYETFNKFCAEEYVFPYGLLKERQM